MAGSTELTLWPLAGNQHQSTTKPHYPQIQNQTYETILLHTLLKLSYIQEKESNGNSRNI